MNGLLAGNRDADGPGTGLVGGEAIGGLKLDRPRLFLGEGDVRFADRADEPADAAARFDQLVLLQGFERLAQASRLRGKIACR